MTRITFSIMALALVAQACSGDDGTNGSNGQNALVTQTAEPEGSNCRYGGTKLTFGTDRDGDGTLTGDEVTYTDYDCNDTECDIAPLATCAGKDLSHRVIFGINPLAPPSGGIPISDSVDLHGIDLRGADLRGTTFIGVNLSNANFAGANLEGAFFLAVLAIGADFTGANMRNFVVSTQAFFAESVMTNVDMTGAVILGTVSFDNIEATGMKLDNVLGAQSFIMSASNANFEGASFTRFTAPASTVRFTGANLTNTNFTGAVFANADFGATGASPTLAGANFTGTTFFGANLTTLNLDTAATFTGAFFSPATTLPAAFDPAARGAIVVAPGSNHTDRDFTQSYVATGVDFTGCTLTRAKFAGMNLGSSSFNNADLTGADLRNVRRGTATLVGANLTNADLTGAELDNAAFTDANLTGTIFAHANLSGATLAGRPASGASFDHATIRGANVAVTGGATANWDHAFRSTSTTLPGDVPAGAVIINVQAGEALAGVDLSYLWLIDESSLWTATDDFTNTNFTGAHLINVDFKGAKLTGARFANARLDESDLSKSDLAGADFSNARMNQATNLGGTNLTGANFTGATAIFLDLGGANATNANFTNADLSCANFALDNINGTPGFLALSGATFSNTVCPDGTIAPAGAPSTFCNQHIVLATLSAPTFSLSAALDCQMKTYRSDPSLLF